MNNIKKVFKIPFVENYKTLLKKLKKCKDNSYLQIGRHNTVIMAILPKLIFRFNMTLYKSQIFFFAEIDKLMLIFKCKWKWPRIIKTILKKIVERIDFSANSLEKTKCSHINQWIWTPNLTTHVKINSKWIKDIHVIT